MDLDFQNPKTLKLAQIILSKVGVCDYWKLLKLMYFIDFESYYVTEKPVTENVYYHLPYGPVPDNYKANIIEKGLEMGLWEKTGEYSLILKNTESIENIKLEKLDETFVELILEKYGNLTGKNLVSLSHDDPPWYLTNEGEKIDYDLVKWRDSEITHSENITNQVLDA
jgi:uncharacterized phage-associated protein